MQNIRDLLTFSGQEAFHTGPGTRPATPCCRSPSGVSPGSVQCTIYYDTICPRSSNPCYIVTYYINWVTTSWTYIMSIVHVVIERSKS